MSASVLACSEVSTIEGGGVIQAPSRRGTTPSVALPRWRLMHLTLEGTAPSILQRSRLAPVSLRAGMIATTALGKEYGARVLFSGVSLQLDAGGRHGVVGA